MVIEWINIECEGEELIGICRSMKGFSINNIF